MMKQEEIRDIKEQAIKNFITYFKKYARDDSFDQLLWDGNADIVDVDDELDAAFEEYKEKQNDK